MRLSAELLCRSAFSFLDGASEPEELVSRAVALGYSAVGLVDFGGVYGAPRFFQAARRVGLKAIVGAELHVAPPPAPERAGALALRREREHSRPATGAGRCVAPLPDLPGAAPIGVHRCSSVVSSSRLSLLALSLQGYRNLCRLLTLGHAGRAKGECVVSCDELAVHAGGLVAVAGRTLAVRDEPLLDRLAAIFPPGDLVLAISRHGLREEEHDNRVLVELARRRRLPLVATNDVRYAAPDRAALYDVMTCLRLGTTLESAGRGLLPDAERRLLAPEELAASFSDLPGAIAGANALAERCAFTLEDLGYRFPDVPLPGGRSMDAELRERVRAGARERYRPLQERHRAQLEKELAVIAKLGLAGYFLVVHDIVRFCRAERILAQGRGSAANSAVCYVLGITAVDPVGMELLFERFLSEERGEWPDIDLDLPAGEQREKVIQHVYARYGPHGAGMTANVITYRGRLATREVGKVLGLPAEAIDRTAKLFHGWGPFRVDLREELVARAKDAGLPDDRRTRLFLELCVQLHGLPRHLGQHSGGMVVAGGRLDEVVPLEPAAMPGRTVNPWDKDDCGDLGIIKVDLLGLGMLRVLEQAVPLVRRHEGRAIDLAHLPPDDPRTYDMIRRADTVGVFQIESRAQMATLPRMRPERFYDLVVEVALIRPGPIVGKMVSPYLERRAGRQPVVVPHPSLEPILRRTLGVPLFQEQLMRVAMVAAGFTGGEAEELRRAMGSKRSAERMAAIEKKLRAGMAERGISPESADEIVRGIAGFALYGFPESHAASFALIAYASAYLKAHHPAAFGCALLNSWPMGFYHPATIVKDLQRHRVPVLPVDVARSEWACTLERWSGRAVERWGEGAEPPHHRTTAPPLQLRVGFRYVHGLREEAGKRIAEERARAPFASVAELVRRCALRSDEIDVLAEIGALGSFGLERRAAIWQVARMARGDGPLWETLGDGVKPADRGATPPAGRRSAAPPLHRAPQPPPPHDPSRTCACGLRGHEHDDGGAPGGVPAAGADARRVPARLRDRGAARRAVGEGGGDRHGAPAAGDGEGLLLPHAGGRDGVHQRGGDAAALRGAPRAAGHGGRDVRRGFSAEPGRCVDDQGRALRGAGCRRRACGVPRLPVSGRSRGCSGPRPARPTARFRATLSGEEVAAFRSVW
ncbi:MAG: error-prone DNA polymerase [Deltaproteobacteria bacterium]|nr:error-prone DNA polymerase [Deltaproteobacteria bacterium]